VPTFSKLEIARSQLETAVEILLNRQCSSAVITLAGAASTILDELVRREKKETFLDYSIRIREATSGKTPKKKSYKHHIEKLLGVIAHKHMAITDSDHIELDLERMAADVTTAAVCDYIKLNGQSETFIKAFLAWSWANTPNASELMKQFEKVPHKLQPR
jgi:hypothetical protein